MKIGKCEIVTPHEDKIGYDPAWRSLIVDAHLASGERLPNAVRDDHAIEDMLKCMANRPKADLGCRGAIYLRHSPLLSQAVEAFLLTRAGYSQISDDTGIPIGAVKYYELLYFNVRTFAGDPRQSYVLRLSLELESSPEPTTPAEQIDRAMKKAAIEGDIQLLRSFIPYRRSEASQGSFAGTLAQRELNRRLLRGDISTSTLIKMRQLEIAEDRLALSLELAGKTGMHGDGNFYVGDPYVLAARMF